MKTEIKKGILEILNTLISLVEAHSKKSYPMGSKEAKPLEELHPEKKVPFYACGSPDPVYVGDSYTTYSGIDIKIIFETVEGRQTIGTMQGFSYRKEVHKGYIDLTGLASFISFDTPSNWLGKKVRMIAVGMNKDGELDVVLDEEIYFITKSYGISVDNIVSEEIYEFVGANSETVEAHSNRIKNQTENFRKENETA